VGPTVTTGTRRPSRTSTTENGFARSVGHMNRHHSHLAAALLGAALACAHLAGTARADSVCTYDPATHAVNAIVQPATPDTSIKADPASRAILVDGVPCGAATLDDTDQITVLGSGGWIRFNAHDAAFAPGFTSEADGQAEIELAAIGFDAVLYYAPEQEPATITAGRAGIDLDADRDVDLTYGTATEIDVDGSSGGDVVSAQGGGRTGGKLAKTVTFGYGQGSDAAGGLPISVKGHDGPDNLVTIACTSSEVWGYGGDDVLVGCSGASALHGGQGNDRLNVRGGGSAAYGDAGNDTFIGIDRGVDTIDGGRGTDTATVEPDDLLTSIERLS
jgi:Ca2+-binding RTX toxin-like protein